MKLLLISLAVCLASSSCQKKQDSTIVESTLNIVPELSDVVIEGVDFKKAESIASILKGVNIVRGEQNVTLTLDSTRKINIVESYNSPGCPIVFLVGQDGIRMSDDESRMNREEFIVRLKSLAAGGKSAGCDIVHLVVLFDSNVTGVEGYEVLKDLCDNGMALMLCRELTREERAQQLKRNQEKELERKPSSPGSAVKKRAEQVTTPNR